MAVFIHRDEPRLIEFSAHPGDTSVMVADKLDHAINLYPAPQPIRTQEDLDRFAEAWLSQDTQDKPWLAAILGTSQHTPAEEKSYQAMEPEERADHALYLHGCGPGGAEERLSDDEHDRIHAEWIRKVQAGELPAWVDQHHHQS